MNRSHHPLRAAALGLLVAGLLSSCGTDDTGSTGTTPQEGTSQSDTDGATGDQITTASTAFGTFLVDDEGKTLYMFTQDSPGRSTCEGDCPAAWPPVPGEVVAGEGADQDLLGTIERSDGSTQATYADWPLYYFAQDQAAGDVKGQGVKDVWYVLTPEGEPIEKAPAPMQNGAY